MSAEKPAITVMQVLGDPARGHRTSNPYTRLLVESLPSSVRTRYFRWGGILTDDLDVLHVHWPEHLLRHKLAIVRIAKSVLFLLYIVRLRLTRKAIVRTLHNVQPHETVGWLERKTLEYLDRSTTVRVVLNETTPTPPGARVALIPHGHYRDWYQEPDAGRVVRGRILTFGLIRAYKGLDDLVRAFRETTEPDLTLHICGRPDSVETSSVLEELTGGDARVTLDFRFVPDEELAEEIAEAHLVVLPYREVHNSGVALLALSMNRPVLVREGAATRLLRDEFGARWVHLYSGELTGEILRHALAAVPAGTPDGRVDMRSREWRLLATQLTEVYAEAVREARRRP